MPQDLVTDLPYSGFWKLQLFEKIPDLASRQID